MKRFAFLLILGTGPAFAADAPPAPEPPKPVLTAEDGKKLYEYGLKVGMAQGMARAAMEAAQQDVKPILERMQPSPATKP